MIDSIIFDFNGTLLDDFDVTYTIENEVFKSVGLKGFSKKRCKDTFINPINKYYDALGLNDKDYDYKDINSRFFEEYLKRWKEESKLFKNEKEILMDLKARGFKLYILSATEISLLKEQLEYFGIIDLFTDFIAANNKDGKSKIEYGKEFIKKHRLNKDNTILVGDTLHDFESAEAFEIDSIYLTKGHNSKKRLKTLNKKLCNNYKQIEKEILKRNPNLIDY